MPLFTTGYHAAAAIHMPFMAAVFLTGIFELPFELFNRRPYYLSAQIERVCEGESRRQKYMFVCQCLFSVHLWNAFFPPSLILPSFFLVAF